MQAALTCTAIAASCETATRLVSIHRQISIHRQSRALTIAGPSNGPFRNRRSTALHSTLRFDFTNPSQNAPSIQSLRLSYLNADGHFCKCHTAAAAPAEPGGPHVGLGDSPHRVDAGMSHGRILSDANPKPIRRLSVAVGSECFGTEISIVFAVPTSANANSTC